MTALTIEGPLPAYAATIGEVDEVERQKDASSQPWPRTPASRQRPAGIPIEVEVRAGHAAELIRIARDHAADLVVVGHRGHFLEDYVLGSTADRVAHHAPCPVMIVK